MNQIITEIKSNTPTVTPIKLNCSNKRLDCYKTAQKAHVKGGGDPPKKQLNIKKSETRTTANILQHDPNT